MTGLIKFFISDKSIKRGKGKSILITKMENNKLKVGLAQIAPVWLKKKETTKKVIEKINDAGTQNCQLVTFGETLLPGYPFWIERTDGARFDSKVQKELYAHYLSEAVQIENGDLDEICNTAKQNNTAVYLGIVERAKDRGSHSVYCSLVYINQKGNIGSVHRKMMPTYDERMVWSIGDGNGLLTHPLGEFTLGGLNCWENWMPLSRTALYAQGEDLHVAVWPGSKRNTEDITRFIAKESRSFVISVSGLLRKSDIPSDIPHSALIGENSDQFLANGGSCIAGPDGNWVVEPVINDEKLITAEIDHQLVKEERHNFDPAGHYSRPDVTQLTVNRERQSIAKFND